MKIALKGTNGKYVCAEENENFPVVVNRGVLGPWEKFTVEVVGLSTAGNQIIALKAESNNKYVRLERDTYELKPDRNVIGPDEKYEVIWDGTNKLSLKAANDFYAGDFTANHDVLLAKATAVGPEEIFEVEIVSF